MAGKVINLAAKAATKAAKSGADDVVDLAARRAKKLGNNVIDLTTKSKADGVVDLATKRAQKAGNNVVNLNRKQKIGASPIIGDYADGAGSMSANIPKTKAVNNNNNGKVINMPKNNTASKASNKANNGGAKGVIDTNNGEGFLKTVWNNAIGSGLAKKADDITGIGSFVSGFGEAGSKYEGSVVSKAAQNAGYIKKNAAGEFDVDYKKIAAGYMGASTVARVATGGGLYKDGQGNTNVVGVPLI